MDVKSSGVALIAGKYFVPSALIFSLLFIDSRLLDFSLLSKKLALDITLLVMSIFLLFEKGGMGFINKRRKQILYIFLIFLIFRGLSLIYAGNIFEALYEFSRDFEVLFLLLILFKRYQNGEEFLHAFKPFFLFFAFASVLMGWIQVIQTMEGGALSADDTYKITSFFSHRNMHAQILALSIPFLFYYSSYKGISRIISIILLLCTLSLISILLCRTAWLAASSSIVLLILSLFVADFSGIKKHLLVFAGLAIVISILTSTLEIINKEDLLHQVQTLTKWNYGSASKRMDLWHGSIDMIKEAPILGQGLADWRIDINRFIGSEKVVDNGLIFFQRPHNDFLWIWCESGIIVLGFYVFMFLFVLRSSFLLFKSKISIGSVGLLSFLGLISYCILATLSFPKERTEHQIFLVTFIFLSLPYSEEDPIPFKRRTWFLMALFTLVFLFLDLTRYRGEILLKKAFEERNRINWTGMLNYVNLAKNEIYTIDGTSAPLDFYCGLAHLKLQNYKDALTEFKKAEKINPYNIQVLKNLGAMYFANSKPDSALVVYDKALKINPSYNEAIVNKAMILINKNEFNLALDALHNIDLENYNDSQKAVVYEILHMKIMGMFESETDKTRRSILFNIANTREWTMDLFQKHILEKRTFMNQLELDVKYVEQGKAGEIKSIDE